MYYRQWKEKARVFIRAAFLFARAEGDEVRGWVMKMVLPALPGPRVNSSKEPMRDRRAPTTSRPHSATFRFYAKQVRSDLSVHGIDIKMGKGEDKVFILSI